MHCGWNHYRCQGSQSLEAVPESRERCRWQSPCSPCPPLSPSVSVWMQPSDFPKKENPAPRQTEVVWRKKFSLFYFCLCSTLSLNPPPRLIQRFCMCVCVCTWVCVWETKVWNAAGLEMGERKTGCNVAPSCRRCFNVGTRIYYIAGADRRYFGKWFCFVCILKSVAWRCSEPQFDI